MYRYCRMTNLHCRTVQGDYPTLYDCRRVCVRMRIRTRTQMCAAPKELSRRSHTQIVRTVADCRRLSQPVKSLSQTAKSLSQTVKSLSQTVSDECDCRGGCRRVPTRSPVCALKCVGREEACRTVYRRHDGTARRHAGGPRRAGERSAHSAPSLTSSS